ncbi:hypothetical protein [Tuwongella immobilis]|uniref:Uncharacterized protein n=1 Tax=Tuwongella immobilis TaxID=692036 RepID=A0A6C2YW42_9BACT|nr:hypothetical protein [Tuwongella immobilis]VIP05189.1 unnamed protein product [Tuwongella immobilis]VTS07734.1 unnamed protein product [Tuwongella immobilis]
MTLEQSKFVNELRNLHSSLAEIIDRRVSEDGSFYCYSIMHGIYEFLLTNPPNRADIARFLAGKLDPYHDDEISNLIAIGFVESIESESQLNQILHNCGESVDSIRVQWALFMKSYPGF